MTLVLFGYRGVISGGPSEEDMATMAGAAGVAVGRLEDAYWQLRPAYDLAELDAPAYWQQLGRLPAVASRTTAPRSLRLSGWIPIRGCTCRPGRLS